MKTGIVILNYNDLENTKNMLNQIKDYECLNKIVVVDNASKDDSYNELKKYESKKIIILEAKKNKGYAAGNNIGLKYLQKNTNCELAIISNPDVKVLESVIKILIDDMKKNPDIAFLGPKVLESGKIIKGMKIPSFTNELLSNIPLLHRLATNQLRYKNEYYQSPLTEVEVVHGCFFIGRLSCFKKIKYFDENTFLYYEENILSKKAQEKNLKIYIDTTVAINHELSKSVDKSLNKVKKYIRLKESQRYFEQQYQSLNPIKMFMLKLTYYIGLIYNYLTFWI